MLQVMRDYFQRKELSTLINNRIIYMFMIELVECHINELTLIHGVDTKRILGCNFMSSLKKREIEVNKLCRIYMTVIKPLVNLKRKEGVYAE